MLVLCAAVSAQTLRQENDPRNIAPTVGTGGSPGGPTGLFTIYDGQTLRKGEFTFSVAYSNYDRDPGNVDIVEVPVSFQVGLSDYLELFYNTDAYRGVKVNNPRNLSSFYLPNSQLFFGAGILGSGPAIILAPERVSGTTIPAGAIFRPAFCPGCVNAGSTGAQRSFFLGGQPFVQFPFVGGVGPNLGLTGNNIAPPFTSRLGSASGGGGGHFGAAGNFPGVGSVFGSILPGIVLSTRTIPANLTFQALIVPDTFTQAPVYLPDAPFINRLYGESAFNTHTIGANIRLTGPNNPLSVNLIPMYRFYLDKADDADGFNQLQRGASPGGDIGDFGLFGVVGGRLSRSVHMAVNFGYFLNSNPKSDAFGGGDVILLDRPDEFISGIGFDFPINEHFQPIVEMKTVHYVGGRTPNAFPNNPVDFLGGVRIFPRRWMGFTAAYRAHLNQQGERLFGGEQDFPRGFDESRDPHGFMFQFFAGHRNERAPAVLPNQPPVVNLTASSSRVLLPAECGPGQRPAPCEGSGSSTSVSLAANATDPDGDTLLYTYSTTGGRIVGDGPNATLDLSGAQPGTYTVTVEVDDGCGCVAFSSTTVTVDRCICEEIPVVCPTVRVSCPDSVPVGSPITFTASVEGGDTSVTPTFNWSVSAGTITSGQGTSSITVDTTGIGGQTVTATVDVGGYGAECRASNSCTTSVLAAPANPRKFDEYGNIRFNDEKARLDNFAVALQNEPGSQGVIIGYGGRRGRAGEAQARADRARDYLVNERGIEAGRITTIDGGYREELTVELWIVPTGATPPTASPTVDASEVQTAPTPRRRRPRRGRRD
jgi:hypothetical protein